MPELYFMVGMLLGGCIGFIIQLTVHVEMVPPDSDAKKLSRWKRIAGILLEGRCK